VSGQPRQRVTRADHPVSADLDAGEVQFTGAVLARRQLCCDRDSSVGGGDQEQPCARIGFGRNQEGVRDRGERHLDTGAGQPESVAGRGGLYRALTPFAVECDGQDLLTGHRRRRPLLLQSRGTEAGQHTGAEYHRFQVRDRGKLAAQRGQDGRLLQRPEAATAERLRRGGAQDVGVDQLAPQLGVEALIEAVERALMLGRAHRIDDGADQSREILRCFCSGEIHVSPRVSVSGLLGAGPGPPCR
jgi:hypothetical protein